MLYYFCQRQTSLYNNHLSTRMKKITRHNKNTDNINLLISYDKFQKRVVEIRNFLDIPENGFTNDVAIKNWTEGALAKSDEITESKKFRDQENKIREKVRDKIISPKQAHEEWRTLTEIIPHNYLEHSIKRLIAEFHLPDHYNHFLRRYIISNVVIYPLDSFTITPPSKDKKTVQINVHMRLTDEDLRELKKNVNQCFGKNLPHAQKIADMSTKLEIENLYKNGTEEDVVTGKQYTLTSEDIAERVYGDPTKKDLVYEATRGLKRLRKSRFSNRKTIGQ